MSSLLALLVFSSAIVPNFNSFNTYSAGDYTVEDSGFVYHVYPQYGYVIAEGFGNSISGMFDSLFFSGIRAYVDDYPVLGIGGKAFSLTAITNIEIPSTVIEIMDGGVMGGAFFSCNSLKTVEIPENVERIGTNAFNMCENLQSIYIYNPDCEIVDYELYKAGSTICNSGDGFSGIIYGHANSKAHEYAEKCGYNFVDINTNNTIVTSVPKTQVTTSTSTIKTTTTTTTTTTTRTTTTTTIKKATTTTSITTTTTKTSSTQTTAIVIEPVCESFNMSDVNGKVFLEIPVDYTADLEIVYSSPEYDVHEYYSTSISSGKTYSFDIEGRDTTSDDFREYTLSIVFKDKKGNIVSDKIQNKFTVPDINDNTDSFRTFFYRFIIDRENSDISCSILNYNGTEMELISQEILLHSDSLTLLGDVNTDGMINSIDASQILRFYADVSTSKEPNLTNTQIRNADVNLDGSLDSSDASHILGDYALFSLGLDTNRLDVVANPNTSPNGEYTLEEIESSSIKPVLSVSKNTITLEEAKNNNVVDVSIDLTELNGNENFWCSGGLSIEYDSRLEPVKNKVGGIEVAVGDALNYNVNYIKCNEENNRIFIATTGQSDYGTVGNIITIPFKLPSDTDYGDQYNINLVYTGNEVFANFDDDETSDLMQAYLFTKGLNNGYIKIKEYVPITTTTTTTTTATTTTITTTTTRTTTTTTKTTTKSQTTTATTTTTPAWREAYREKLLDIMVSNSYASIDEYGEDMCSTYAIRDINGDNIPELFVNYMPITASGSVLYTYYNSEVVELMNLPRAGFLSYCPDEGLIESSGGGGAGGFAYNDYFKIVDGEVVTIDSFVVSWGTIPNKYTRNGEEITEEEYNRCISEYRNKNWKEVGRENFFEDLWYTLDDIQYDYYFDYYEAALSFTEAEETISIHNTVNNLPVSSIGPYFFYNTSGVKALNIPANVRNIYLKGLNCDSLAVINVDKNNTSFTSEDGILYTEDMTMLIRVPRAKDVSSFAIPSDVTEILSFAFESCDSLKRIVIPETVTKIDDCAFYLCHNLSSVTILNPECVIDDEYYGEYGVTFCNTCIYPNGNYLGIIQGYDNSTAEKYAQKYDRTFVSLGTNPALTTTSPSTNTTTSTTTITITTTASITTTPHTTTEPAYSLGDVNGDGSVDSTDASAVLAEYAAIQTGNESSFTDKQEEVADVNMDGTIDSSDASVILSYYAYLSTGGTLSMEDYLNPPIEKGFDIKDYPVYGLQLSTIKQSASDLDKCMENELCILYSYKDPAIKFALVDLNSDESPELIVTCGESNSGFPTIAEVYTLIDNNLVKLCQSQERLYYYMCDNNIVASSGGLGQVYGFSYFNYESGSELNLIEYVSHDYTTGKKVIKHSSGKVLTDEEAAEIQEKYVEIALELIEL